MHCTQPSAVSKHVPCIQVVFTQTGYKFCVSTLRNAVEYFNFVFQPIASKNLALRRKLRFTRCSLSRARKWKQKFYAIFICVRSDGYWSSVDHTLPDIRTGDLMTCEIFMADTKFHFYSPLKKIRKMGISNPTSISTY